MNCAARGISDEISLAASDVDRKKKDAAWIRATKRFNVSRDPVLR